jgi:hypothetical protein
LNAGFTRHVERIRLVAHRVRQRDHGFIIVDDLREQSCPTAELAGWPARMIAAGFRSVLIVTVTARDQPLRLAFWSKRPNA